MTDWDRIRSLGSVQMDGTHPLSERCHPGLSPVNHRGDESLIVLFKAHHTFISYNKTTFEEEKKEHRSRMLVKWCYQPEAALFPKVSREYIVFAHKFITLI